MQRGHPTASSFRFVVDTDGRSLWFASWGRAINRHQAAGFDDSVRGFDQDLEKMLTLGWSDKGRTDCGDEPTTGKFGLGFKSVFLATDRPRVVSGRLAFEVLGGLFPAALVEGRKSMQERLRELGPEGRDGTIIELPLNRIDPEKVLGRFIELLPLLVVFGREIHSCVIRPADGPAESYRWECSSFEAVPGAQVGDLPGPERGRILVLRGKSSATVLGLGQEGVKNLPQHLPTVWVTAPTRQVEKLGFAVNAPFDLDVGRSQLAYSSSENDKVAATAGLEIGEVLVALFRQADAKWEAFAQTLGLGRSTSHLGFWESVWERLGKPLAGHPDPHGPLLRGMFWGAVDRGMRRLVSECEALPNGLWGDDRALTHLGHVRAMVSGLLDSEDVYSTASRWPSFHLNYPPHSLISGRVLKDLARLASKLVPCCTEVTLCAAIKGELGSKRRAEPRTAATIGAFVSPSFINYAASRGVSASQEIASLITDLADLEFQSSSGDWNATSCLVVSGNDDEGLRADFAPAQCVLSDDYAGDALNFFRVCRNQLRADAKQLKSWALDILDDKRRNAVLRYIVSGELGQALAAQLFGQTSGTWLARIEESEIVNKGFTRNEAAIILALVAMQKLASSSVAAIRRALRGRLERIGEARQQVDQLRDRLDRYREMESGSDLDAMAELEEKIAAGSASLSLMEGEEHRLRELIAAAELVECETRIERIVDLIRTRFNDRSVLFFTEYKATQSLLMSSLFREFGDGCTTFINGDGQADGVADSAGRVISIRESRDRAADRFNDGAVRFLVSTEAAGEGIDLQEQCFTLIHVDLPWNPMRMHQRVGRLNRIGQQRRVEVVIIRNPDTVEGRIWSKLNAKIESIMRALGGVMQEPEDLMELVLGMAAPSLFTELYAEAGTMHPESLSDWFDRKTAQLRWSRCDLHGARVGRQLRPF